MPREIFISGKVEQLSSGQDYICEGDGIDAVTGESVHWVMLNDGHGTDSCINFIRSTPTETKSELICSADPVNRLAKYIDESHCVKPWESSGATVVIVKCYSDRIECINAGDSQFLIFKDGELIHISEEHNCSNEKEKERLVALNKEITFDPSVTIKVVSETELTNVYSGYVKFSAGNLLATTQALGHNSKTGYAPYHHVVMIEPESSYRIVMGSDGVFDMTMMDNAVDIEFLKTKTADEICDKAVGRWLQEWIGIMPDGSRPKFSFTRKQSDDVSAVVLDITKREPMVPF
jgi:serine/threonine protein phosphatase PrpC